MTQEITLILGDCLEELKKLPCDYIDCCITSPPYWGLRDYGVKGQFGLEKTPEEYVNKMLKVFNEVKRVLKKEGTLWLNLGDSYATQHETGTTDKAKGWTSATGIGGRQLEHARAGNGGLPSKNLIGIPWRVAFALQKDGWYLRQDIIWHKLNPMPESVTDRCTKAHEYIFLLTKSQKYYFDNKAIREANQTKYTESWGNFKRNKIVGKMADLPMDKNKFDEYRKNGRNRRDVWEISDYHIADKFADELRTYGINEEIIQQCLFNTFVQCKSVWTVNTKPFKEAHFATFPENLILPCVLAGCPENGIILDPFSGAGTTGVVAKKKNRRFIGIEINEKYFEIAQRRINNATKEMFV